MHCACDSIDTMLQAFAELCSGTEEYSIHSAMQQQQQQQQQHHMSYNTKMSYH
jgi:hypothetical protein